MVRASLLYQSTSQSITPISTLAESANLNLTGRLRSVCRSTVSTSALSSLLSSLNNGNSGFDVTSAVAAVIAAERQPETLLQNQQTALNAQASALQQLGSQASLLTTALQALGDDAGTLSDASATSSDTSVLTATAAPGTAAGTHTVVVQSLAATGSGYSAEQSSNSATLASGDFDLVVGGKTTHFTTGSGNGSDDTLNELAASINAAGVGVNASVVNDANGARLALVAQSSGTAADFTIANDTSGLQLTKGTAGADASLKVDGVPVTSATNTVTGAVAGLTLSLQSVNQNAVTVSTAPDTSAITTAVSSFVSAYNTIIQNLNSQFTYNSNTKTEGTLGSDSVARSLQSDVLSATNLNIGSGAYSTLASIGISTQQDGTLSLDSSKLNAALSSNFSGVVAFFQGTISSSATTPGFATSFASTLSNYTDATQGAFTVDLKSISNEYKDLGNQIDDFERYIASQQTLLTTEYNNANIALQQLPQQIKQVQAILGDNSSSSK